MVVGDWTCCLVYPNRAGLGLIVTVLRPVSECSLEPHMTQSLSSGGLLEDSALLKHPVADPDLGLHNWAIVYQPPRSKSRTPRDWRGWGIYAGSMHEFHLGYDLVVNHPNHDVIHDDTHQLLRSPSVQ